MLISRNCRFPSSRHGLATAIVYIFRLASSPEFCSAFVIDGFVPRSIRTHSTTSIFNNKDNELPDIPPKDIEDEWDGVVIEGAHDEEFDTGTDEVDAFVPSLNFMSMASSMPSTILDSGFSNAGKLHQTQIDDDEPDEDDLLEMGGDPFFLDEEWDGIPIEGAHDEEFEPGSGKIDAADIFVSSASFMSMASSLPSPILGDRDFDPLRNMGKLHKDELEEDSESSEDALLEMGGDPFFLDDGDSVEKEQVKMSKELDEPNDFEWDGFVDEDAHLDFD